MQKKETLFDLLFWDDEIDEQYSPLGIALLLSLVLHLLFATVIKVTPATPKEAPASPPAYVSFEFENEGVVKISSRSVESQQIPFFGFQEEIFDPERALPPFKTSVLKVASQLFEEPTEVLLAQLIEVESPGLESPIYPLNLELDGSLSSLRLISDGSYLFQQDCRECITLAPILCKTPHTITALVTVNVLDGRIAKYKIMENQVERGVADKRLQQVAELVLQHLQFESLNPTTLPCVDSPIEATVEGTICMKFSCSGDIAKLLLRPEYNPKQSSLEGKTQVKESTAKESVM